MEKKKLGLLLSTPPSHPSANTVSALCTEAICGGYDVYLYLIDEGVANVHDPRFLKLPEDGVKMFVCAYGCQQHGVSTNGFDPRVSLCGLVVLSNMISGCDRFLAFN